MIEYFDALGTGGTAAHLNNSVVVEGRSGVTFRNQFAVLTPVGPAGIRSIGPPTTVTLVPDEHLAPLIFG